MSEEKEEETYEAPPPEPTVTPEPYVEKPPRQMDVDEVTVRAYPKTMLFYPTMLLSLVLAVFTWLAPLNPLFVPILAELFSLLAFIWFIFFLFNLLVVTFEFGKGIVVALILVAVIIIMALGWYFTVTGILVIINPVFFGLVINANSMLAFFIVFAFVLLLAWISTRFYYFRITHNEIIYKKGILGDVERYGTTNVTVYKEIRDIFEFIFFRSGRLTISVPGRKMAIVIDNIPNINLVERKVLSILQRIEIDLG